MFRHGANRRRNTTNDVAGLVELPYVNNTSFEIHLVTKNLQSVRAHDRWNDFVSELEALDYDIAFCTETWREEKEEHCLTPSGHHIYLSGGDGHRGVGICISPSFLKRMKHIHFHAYSSRVSCLHFEIVDTKFVAIVCYMPTSWDTDAAVEEIYSLLELLFHTAERMKAVSLFGGDFNASIGAPRAGDDLTLIGACGNGARNRRGARMIHWILEHGLQVLNRLDSTMTIEECWTCRRAMDGALVQLDFLLASLRVRVVRAWVDQSLPVGVDHRCVHSFIRIGGLRRAQIKRCTKLKHWQPDLDENGTPSGFHTTVTTALTKLPAVSAEGLEQCLVVAGRNHGRHGSQHLRFVPSRLLADVRLRRRQTNAPQNQKQLSFQIRKLHRKKLRDWKSNQLERLLKQSSKWKILRTMDYGTGRWLPQQPQPFEFANMLEQLFAGNPGRPMVEPRLTEAPWTMAERKKAITRLKTNKAATPSPFARGYVGGIVALVSDGAFDWRSAGNMETNYIQHVAKNKGSKINIRFSSNSSCQVIIQNICVFGPG